MYLVRTKYIRRKGSSATHVTSAWRRWAPRTVPNAARVARADGKNLAPNDIGVRILRLYLEWSVRDRHGWAGKLLLGADGSSAPFS